MFYSWPQSNFRTSCHHLNQPYINQQSSSLQYWWIHFHHFFWGHTEGVPGSYAVSAFRLSRNDKNCSFSKVALRFLSLGVYGGFCLCIFVKLLLSGFRFRLLSEFWVYLGFDMYSLIPTLGETVTCLSAIWTPSLTEYLFKSSTHLKTPKLQVLYGCYKNWVMIYRLPSLYGSPFNWLDGGSGYILNFNDC